MNCPKCGANNQARVIYTVSTTERIGRRRECMQCGSRFNTVETVTDGPICYDRPKKRRTKK